MSAEMIIGIAGQAIYTVLKAAGPLLLSGLVVGLVVSILQATTQIQEQTLAFVPKIVAILLAVLVFGPWILNTLVNFASRIFENLYRFVG
jgi:flagellar biosynthetic protein FliQ